MLVLMLIVWMSFRLWASGVSELCDMVWFFMIVVAVIDVGLSLIGRVLWSVSSISSVFRWGHQC